MDDKTIKLYNSNGANTKFCLLITDDKYFITKQVIDTKYRTIIIQEIENPFNIILNTDDKPHLYIDSSDMWKLENK